MMVVLFSRCAHVKYIDPAVERIVIFQKKKKLVVSIRNHAKTWALDSLRLMTKRSRYVYYI